MEELRAAGFYNLTAVGAVSLTRKLCVAHG